MEASHDPEKQKVACDLSLERWIRRGPDLINLEQLIDHQC